MPTRDRAPTDRAERWLARLAWMLRLLTVPFVRYDIRGGRCAAELQVAVIAANHRSMFDVVAGLICLHHFGHYPRLLIDRHYVEQGWTRPLAGLIGAIPVDRTGAAGTSLDAAVAALQDGIPILVMPEGRLHWDPDAPLSTGPAKTGVARLAGAGSVPVVPAALVGTERVLPKGAKVPRFNPFRRKRVVCIVADDPLWLAGDDPQADTEQVMAAIRGLMATAA